ncbi:MAG TPA: hypothetical protein VLM78_04350, partial [Anaerolineales bacterium]|nr:hypothetical protein [Anaerolineales bacterium]
MRLPEIFKNPRVAAITGIILGLILGLMVGWWLWPVEYTDAVPAILKQQYQEEYLRMAVDSYRINQDSDLAFQRWVNLGTTAPSLLDAILKNPGAQKPALISDYQGAIESRIGPIALPSDSSPTVPPTDTSTTSSTTPPSALTFLWIAGAILAVGVIGWAVYRYMLRPILYGKHASTGEVSAARQAQDFSKSVERTDFAGLGLAKPVTQNMTTYVLGDDLYDESFSIDSQAGEFLGEYGVGVSETMGV